MRERFKTFMKTLLLCVFLSIVLKTLLNLQNRSQKMSKYIEGSRKYMTSNNYIELRSVLERIGYQETTEKTSWSLLWYSNQTPKANDLKPHQIVNGFPGMSHILSKVLLSTSGSKYVPKSFKLPQGKKELMKYASENKNAMFLIKSKGHRGISLKNVSEINWEDGKVFVQELVQRPLLVDGHMFDIGVYVVLLSVNPLRVYWYKGEVGFRFCPEKYYPFDAKNLNKYVIRDHYKPPFKMPSLAYSYNMLGFSRKDSFDIYMKSKGINSSKIWEDVPKIIADTFINNEHYMIEALKRYPSSEFFFHLMRFDLIVDEDLKVYLIEGNHGPNLKATTYPFNELLYQQVLYNVFLLTGVSNPARGYIGSNHKEKEAAKDMVSSFHNIAVWGEECAHVCGGRCVHPRRPQCALCRPCLPPALRASLLRAHTEYMHRGDFRRLFPPPMTPQSTHQEELVNLSEINKLQYLWYQGKCNVDPTWCT